MRKLTILLFVEDKAQEFFLKPLLARLSRDAGADVSISVRSASRGFGRVKQKLEQLFQAWRRDQHALPDLIVAAADANSVGYNQRRKEILDAAGDLADHVVVAIPDPYIERWLLLDSQAFKEVIGQGCPAPDRVYEKERYKQLLSDAVRNAGIDPALGGLEYAEDLANALNFQTLANQDKGFENLCRDFRQALRRLTR